MNDWTPKCCTHGCTNNGIHGAYPSTMLCQEHKDEQDARHAAHKARMQRLRADPRWPLAVLILDTFGHHSADTLVEQYPLEWLQAVAQAITSDTEEGGAG